MWVQARVWGAPVSLRSWWDRSTGAARTGKDGAGRVSGPPPSANGASSFHLGWVLAGPCRSVAVVVEVLEAPVVPRLYFWALQADVATARGRVGGAHLGLQWHPGHPGSTAVNWGGYRSSGAELDGSVSSLPSATSNPNTRDFEWWPRRRYDLTIEPVDGLDGDAPDGAVPDGAVQGRTALGDESAVAWRGSVRDLETGELTIVRDLYLPGDRIVAATMWSEVFARCDDPRVKVRWSSPLARSRGRDHAVERVQVNYQTHQDGGCANTDSATDGTGLVQVTNTQRLTPQGTSLAVPRVARR